MMKNSIKLNALAFKISVAVTVAAALVVGPLSASQADTTPKFGAKCSAEGVSTGTSTSSLVCQQAASGLRWAKVYVSGTRARPVAALPAPKGTIEFYHWRPEDKAIFASIIDKFQAANPGAFVNQVISSSVDYTNLAFAKIKADPKAAIFVTSRGGQFNQFYAGGLLRDITSEHYVTRNVVKSALGPATINNRVFGVPYQFLFNDPLINTEIFAKNKWAVPTTWAGTLAFCKSAKAAGYIPFAFPGATRGNAGQLINSFLMNSAPDLATLTSRIQAIDTGKADLTSDWFTTIANQYKAMADAGCFPANVTGYTDTSAAADFANGKAAVYPTGTFSIGTVVGLNPAMKGKMKLLSFMSVDSKPLYQGIFNDTFILSVNRKASTNDQNIARAFISFLAQAPIAQEYALGTSQHVTIVNVNYSANVDLLNTSDFMSKNVLLAPRFLFNNVGTVRNPLEDALIAIAGGADVTATLASTSKTIKQGLTG
jgi:raffinose/stachyose/melibiose transport system substrate-binding protein